MTNKEVIKIMNYVKGNYYCYCKLKDGRKYLFELELDKNNQLKKYLNF